MATHHEIPAPGAGFSWSQEDATPIEAQLRTCVVRLEPPRLLAHAFGDGVPYSTGETARQFLLDRGQRIIDRPRQRPHALPHRGPAELRQALPVSRLDVAQRVVRVLLAADGHRQLGLLVRD